MQDDCIAVALGLPELIILGQVELDDHFEVTVRYRWDKVGCPTCGSTMVREHHSMFQRKKDRKLRDKIVVLTLEKRRFRCFCCGKVFTEPEDIFSPRRRSTKRLRNTSSLDWIDRRFSDGIYLTALRLRPALWPCSEWNALGWSRGKR